MPTWAKPTAGFGGKPARDVPGGRAAFAVLAEGPCRSDLMLAKASRGMGPQTVALALAAGEASR